MLKIVKGDLFKQDVQCFVNPWNMNYIPWFLLWPHGVSGRLKKIAGFKPFNQLLSKGIILPGKAVITSGGKISQVIIHVAGLKWYWVATHSVVEDCTRNALKLAHANNIKSIAFPLIGTGVGGLKTPQVLEIMTKVSNEQDWGMDIILVEYEK